MTAGEESPGGSSQDGRTNEKCSLCFYEVKMTTQAGGNPVDCMTRGRQAAALAYARANAYLDQWCCALGHARRQLIFFSQNSCFG